MKTILVPTDFSSSAENALFFASLLAKKQHAKLIMLHAFQLPVPIAEISYNILHEEKENKKKEINAKLLLERDKIKNAEAINVEFLSIEGFAKDVILDFSNNKTIDYIIMGTNGAGKHTSGMFGSTASHIIEKANCPVIAIPETASFKNEIKKITFATDFHSNDIDAIDKIIDIASTLHAHIKILHISDTETSSEEEKVMMYNFTKKVNAKTSYQNMTFQILASKDVETQLEEYIKSHDADMIVMSTHFRGFMDRLFKKSITKEIVLKTTIPLVAFHYDAKMLEKV